MPDNVIRTNKKHLDGSRRFRLYTIFKYDLFWQYKVF